MISGPAPRACLSRGQRGFSILEVIVSLAMVVVGLVGVGASLISMSQQSEQNLLRLRVLSGAEGLMEEILGADPTTLTAVYDGAAFPVAGVVGEGGGPDVLAVAVDTSDPLLPVVTIQGSWQAAGNVETLSLRAELFNEDG